MRLLVALTEVFHSNGGIPMFNRALLRALSDFCQRTGAEARVLVLNDFPDDVDSRYVAASAVRVHGCQRNKTAFGLRCLRALAAGPDLVVLGHAHLLSLAVAARARGCPYWLLAHGIEAWQRLPWLARRALARARTVLAVSDYTRQQLARQNGLAAERWHVFPNALDPFWTPVSETPAARPTLLSVTRLDARERGKGIEQVLEVLPRLRTLVPALRYVVVGEGDDRPRLQGRARALGVDDCVEFTGYLSRPELAHLYAACDVFVLPSVLEGFGIVFLEAMAYAKPVVAARAGGVPEVVAEGETGLLVEPGDLNTLQAALLRLLADPGLRRRLGAAGSRRVQENFAFERFRQRLARHLVEELPEAAYLAHRRRFCGSLLPPAADGA